MERRALTLLEQRGRWQTIAVKIIPSHGWQVLYRLVQDLLFWSGWGKVAVRWSETGSECQNEMKRRGCFVAREQAGFSLLLYPESDSCAPIWHTTLPSTDTTRILYTHRGKADKILSGWVILWIHTFCTQSQSPIRPRDKILLMWTNCCNIGGGKQVCLFLTDSFQGKSFEMIQSIFDM